MIAFVVVWHLLGLLPCAGGRKRADSPGAACGSLDLVPGSGRAQHRLLPWAPAARPGGGRRLPRTLPLVFCFEDLQAKALEQETVVMHPLLRKGSPKSRSGLDS